MKNRNHFKDVLFGVSVGDALGVPVEFKSRKAISYKPVTDMIGYGTYNQPPGTWSDDSSLTFCLADALVHGLDYYQIAENFVNWLDNNLWTPYGEVFDIGITTQRAIDRLKTGINPISAGEVSETSNGNGSLMRILPLVFFLKNKNIDERFEIIQNVSSLTHAHIRSVIACFYYLEFARELICGKDKFEIYSDLKSKIPIYLEGKDISTSETQHFWRIFDKDITEYDEKDISSSGYVIHSLEASLWCLLTTDNYKSAVLKAVNLGEDTDTTAAITGGLAALVYGYETIPKFWISELAETKKISALAEKLRITYL